MKRTLSSLFLIGMGVLLLAVARRGQVTGQLRAGVAGWRPYRPSRVDNPVGFYFYLALYYTSGMVLTVWGILALLGGAPPIRWR